MRDIKSLHFKSAADIKDNSGKKLWKKTNKRQTLNIECLRANQFKATVLNCKLCNFFEHK